MNFYVYWRLFLRRLPLIVLLVGIGSAVGVWLALTLPTVYRAQAVMIVESEQIPDELAASTVQTAATEQIQIIEQRILTRQVLLEMANRLNIYPADSQKAGTAKVEDLRRRITITVKGGAVRRREQQATIVTVSFDAPTAAMAANVTNELVTLMLQENASMRQSVSGQTLEFFVQEVDRLGQEMSRLSARILTFQEENLEALPDGLEFRRSQQAAAQERTLQIDRNIAALVDRRERLIDLFADVEIAGTTTPARQQTVEERQLAALRQEFANLVAVLSLDNPKVVLLRARIEALERVVAGQPPVSQDDASDTGLRAPPSQFEIDLADIDGQIEILKRQREEIEKQMAILSQSIRATPGNALTLEAMERDYENLRAQYNQAVANKARAETGDMIESLSKGQRISLVEQAIAPRAPVSPNRPLVAVGGFSGGLLLGIGVLVLMELLNTTVRVPGEISARLGITTLATVPYIRTRQEIRTKRLRAAGAVAVVCLIGLGLAGLLLPPEIVNRALEQAVQGVTALSDLTRAAGGAS